MEDPHEVLDGLGEGVIPTEDQYKMLRALEECEEKLETEFSRIFSFDYRVETKLIVIELDSYGFDLSFGVHPYEDAYTPVSSHAPLIASGSVDLYRYLDVGIIEQEDAEGEYIRFGEKLFTRWVSKVLPKFTDYKDFPYQIGRAFRDGSKCYDAVTGKRIEL